MKRRQFLKGLGAASVAALVPSLAKPEQGVDDPELYKQVQKGCFIDNFGPDDVNSVSFVVEGLKEGDWVKIYGIGKDNELYEITELTDYSFVPKKVSGWSDVGSGSRSDSKGDVFVEGSGCVSRRVDNRAVHRGPDYHFQRQLARQPGRVLHRDRRGRAHYRRNV